MHSLPAIQSSTERVSRRGYRESSTARQLSSVTPCLHTAITREDGIR